MNASSATFRSLLLPLLMTGLAAACSLGGQEGGGSAVLSEGASTEVDIVTPTWGVGSDVAPETEPGRPAARAPGPVDPGGADVQEDDLAPPGDAEPGRADAQDPPPADDQALPAPEPEDPCCQQPNAPSPLSHIDLCGNGMVDVPSPAAPPCLDDDEVTRVRTRAELDAWLANPVTSLQLSQSMDFGGQPLVIETHCSVKLNSCPNLTGLTELTVIASGDIDLGSDVRVAGPVTLWAGREIKVRCANSIAGGATELSMEAPYVDDHGDATLSARYCIDASTAILRQSSREHVGTADVYVQAEYIDLHGDFVAPRSMQIVSTGDMIFRQSSHLDDAGSIHLEAGGELEFRGEIQDAAFVYIRADNAVLRHAGSIRRAGLATLEIRGMLHLRGKVIDGGAVNVNTGQFQTYRSHDMRGNGDCLISGAHLASRAPLEGCVLDN